MDLLGIVFIFFKIKNVLKKVACTCMNLQKASYALIEETNFSRLKLHN